MATAVLMTVFNRPQALERSLPSVARAAQRIGAPILIVDDGSSEECLRRHLAIAKASGAELLHLPQNRGLACALNTGVSYWLADRRYDWISYFQDDVEVDPLLFEVLGALNEPERYPLLTCHDAPEHLAATEIMDPAGIRVLLKENCRATHLHAHRDYWRDVMPVPTRELGAPKRIEGMMRGIGSNVDWWIARNCPRSIVARGGRIACVPNLVRSFYYEKQHSTWDNEVRSGAEPPLSHGAILEWEQRRNLPLQSPAYVATGVQKLAGDQYRQYWKKRIAEGPENVAWAGMTQGQAEAQAEDIFSFVRPRLLELSAPKRVMEFGCGYGRMLRRLRALWSRSHLFGIDISPEAISNCYRDPRVYTRNAEVPPDEWRNFDIVFTCTVLQHITDEGVFRRAVNGLHRAVKPKGYLALFENVSSPGASHVRDAAVEDYLRAVPGRVQWQAPILHHIRGQAHALMIGQKLE